MSEPVDVSFLLPGLAPAGGVRAVLELANHLPGLGVSSAVVVPERSLLPPKRSLTGVAVRALPAGCAPSIQRMSPRREVAQDWFPLRVPLLPAGAPPWKDIPDSRVIVATSWRTAEELLRHPRAGQRGVYLIQHMETWSGPRRRVEATWRAFDRIVVTSEWLREIAATRFGKQGVGLAVYGVDHEVFSPSRREPGDPPVVGFMWDPREWKGGSEVLEALERVRSAHDVRIRAFGLGDGSALPSWVGFAGKLSGTALADFYRNLDLFVSGSWTETGPMTVPEAMACGVPVVTTDVGNVRLWSGQTEALRVVPPRDAAELAGAIAQLVEDAPERARMSAASVGSIAPFTWSRMTEDFLTSLRSFGLLEGAA